MMKDAPKMKEIYEKTGKPLQLGIAPEMLRSEPSPQVEKMYQDIVGKEKTLSRPTMQQKQVSARRRARASARPLISPDRKPGPAVAPISSAIEDVSKLGV